MRKRVLGILIGLAVALGIAIPATTWMHGTVANSRTVPASTRQPVILIPGSSATQERFNTLVDMLNQQTRGHSLVKVTVKTDGSITTSGTVTTRDREPYIVVAFEDNADGYPNIKHQARWFATAFKTLAQRYQFNHFSGIGHSNGGLVWTIFLEEEMDQTQYHMRSLMTIGTPYNLEESNINNRTQMLTDLVAAKAALPTNLNVYAVAGTESLDSDGIVPISSAEAGKYIFQNQVAHYTLTTVSGEDATHSALVQNRQILDLITQYVLAHPNDPARPIGPTRRPGR